MFVKKGDTVKVISGDNKGKIGKVLKVLVSENRVVVEGVNIVSRHTRPSNAYPDGGIIKKEAPIAISNVMVYDVKAAQATRVGYKEENGKRVRFAKKSGNLLDK
ncbi:MAG TPA: 50S ribosomal protein L24 [Bacilli bacterium]|jgi:large subunit ribosomal protein L24|nr:50S ribosomal protein L24 [Acholeplasmataceae bacterium]HNZ77419.1 50S ribosomal protein L24 [Bacilli bacterium]HOH61624.1 50S ribosomal protein L24 [Bacilli bacterium]HPB48828.1 50S ribosomal protein L24 [Bacilli bacterium]HPM14705.1 50S ribosomal protein L24 [Bacilli bacterium]